MTASRLLARLNPRVLLRGLALIGSLVAFGYLLEVTQFGTAINEAWIDGQIRGHGLTGGLLYVAFGTAFMAFGLPRQIVSFLGGYAYGFALGCVLALIGEVLACAASFYYARLLARGPLQARFSGRIRRFDEFLRRNPFATTLLIRLLPVSNNLVTNLVAGVSSVPARKFIAGSALGFIPQTALFALIGAGISIDPALSLGLGLLLLAAAGALGLWLYRSNRRTVTPPP